MNYKAYYLSASMLFSCNFLMSTEIHINEQELNEYMQQKETDKKAQRKRKACIEFAIKKGKLEKSDDYIQAEKNAVLLGTMIMQNTFNAIKIGI